MSIYSLEEIHNPAGPFRGWEASISQWQSTMPTPNALQILNLTGTLTPDSQAIFEMDGRTSVATGLRNCIAQIASSWGYFQRGMSSVRGIFKDPIAIVETALSQVSAFFGSEAFNAAVNAIGWVPVVGWIIKILVLIVKSVIKIARAIEKKAQATAAAKIDEMKRDFYVPRGEFDPAADTLVGKILQRRLSATMMDFQWMVQPPLLAKNASDFFATPQMSDDSDCRLGWLIGPNVQNIESTALGGLGYVPGTMNIHSSLSMSTTSNYGLIRDTGNFFPVTQTMAGSLWAQAVQGDTAMIFACETDVVRDQWMDYVQSAMGFAMDQLSKGWSAIAGPTSFGSSKYTCTRCDKGISTGCSDFKGASTDEGKLRTIPQSRARGHQWGYINYFRELFGLMTLGGNPLPDTFTVENFKPNMIDYEAMIPVKALDNLYDRQVAMLNSMKCMYLDDSNVQTGSNSTQRFMAIRRGTDLHQLWEDNVQAMFDSGDWKRIDYRDVIKGEEVDQAIHQATANIGTTPEKFFNMNSPSPLTRGRATKKFGQAGGPSVLGDPTPPTPPDPVDFEPRPTHLGSSGTSTKKPQDEKGMGTGTKLVLGAAAVGLGAYAYKKLVK